MHRLAYTRAETDHGPWWFAWSGDGVVRTAHGALSRDDFLALLDDDAEVSPDAAPPASVDTSAVSGDFRRRVLDACAAIPRGEVRTYGELAAECGSPRAARAVGSAMATNPVPLVVPCHRVVRGDGAVGQYSAGGPEQKIRMLEAEGVDVVDGRVMRDVAA